MKIKVTFRPRLRSKTKAEISSETGKLFLVVDDQQMRHVNPIPDDKKFHVNLIADEIVTNADFFNCAYEALEKYPLYLAPDFVQAINDIADKADKKGVEFLPFKKMLRALYRDTERVALYLKRQDKDIDIDTILKYKDLFKIDDKKSAILSFEARIFSELISVKEYYTKFNQIAAKYYDKENHKILRKHLSSYATGYSEPNKWICAVALEVLSMSGVNVFDIGLDNEFVASIWVKSNPNRELSEVLGVLNFGSNLK